MGAFPRVGATKLGPSSVRLRHSTFEAEDVQGQEVVDQSIGDIIRHARSLSDVQIEQIVAYQRSHGVRFGDAAIALRLASREDVLWALSQQFHYPYLASSSAGFDSELVVATDPFGEQAEVFRQLRNQLLTGVLAPDQPLSALAVLSANSGDGKSYFAANMAVAMSQLGARTLLIDADMRTPRQHRLFGIAKGAGLSGILSGRAETEVIQPVSGLPSLYVLPVGVLPPNPTELVQRSTFTLLLQEIMGKFEHVIVDTPAASHGADARAIASKCGSAVVIGRRNTSAVKPMQNLLQSLAASRTRVAGVLVNDF